MLKMYHRQNQGGGSPGFCEGARGGASFEEAVRFCEEDPLKPLSDLYAKPGTLMLEGGCGRGQYVAYYTTRGVRVIGLDFAQSALQRLRQEDDSFALCAGDVARLPFRDSTFDLYYSGGVVEHFEEGAQTALGEAWRVLRAGGVLLISVPYFSPLRRAASLLGSGGHRRVSRSAIDGPAVNGNRRFFQYAYTTGEFEQSLSEAGFRVVSTQGYSILWGLYELPLVSRLAGAFQRRRQIPETKPPDIAPVTIPAGRSDLQPIGHYLLRRLAVREDDTLPMAGAVVRDLRWFGANMLMYFCEKG